MFIVFERTIMKLNVYVFTSIYILIIILVLIGFIFVYKERLSLLTDLWTQITGDRYIISEEI